MHVHYASYSVHPQAWRNSGAHFEILNCIYFFKKILLHINAFTLRKLINENKDPIYTEELYYVDKSVNVRRRKIRFQKCCTVPDLPPFFVRCFAFVLNRLRLLGKYVLLDVMMYLAN